jgi:hypothetical protein
MICAIFLRKTKRPNVTDEACAASGPRYRGSNPCLPASLRSHGFSSELRLGRRAKRADVRANSPSGEGCLAEAAQPRRRTHFCVPLLAGRLRCSRTSRSSECRCHGNSSDSSVARKMRVNAPHARYRSPLCLHLEKRYRPGSTLCGSHYQCRRTTCVAQRGSVRSHAAAPTMVDRGFAGVSE